MAASAGGRAPVASVETAPAVIFVNRFFHPDHSATSQMLGDLAIHLAASGMRVRVITSRQRIDDPDADLAPRGEHAGVDIHRVWSSRRGRGSTPGRMLDYATFHLGAGLALWRMCSRGDVIVAKTDPPLISITAGLVARRRGAVLVNWLQDLFPEVAAALGMSLGRGALGRWLTMMRDRSLRGAASNVVLGERMAGRVVAAGVAPSRVMIIENWCDGRAVVPLPREDHPVRREWGLENRFIVGYSGNLGLAHPYRAIAGAAGELADDPRFVFVIVGGGEGRARLAREVARMGLANVRFLPYQPRERLGPTLTAIDLHLISLEPALEGLIVPSKLYGILAAGRPAIHLGAADGEVAQTLEAGGCGGVVLPDDAVGLAAAIRRLADAPDSFARQGAAARRLFEARFDRPRAMARWESVLADAMAEARAETVTDARADAAAETVTGTVTGTVEGAKEKAR